MSTARRISRLKQPKSRRASAPSPQIQAQTFEQNEKSAFFCPKRRLSSIKTVESGGNENCFDNANVFMNHRNVNSQTFKPNQKEHPIDKRQSLPTNVDLENAPPSDKLDDHDHLTQISAPNIDAEFFNTPCTHEEEVFTPHAGSLDEIMRTEQLLQNGIDIEDDIDFGFNQTDNESFVRQSQGTNHVPFSNVSFSTPRRRTMATIDSQCSSQTKKRKYSNELDMIASNAIQDDSPAKLIRDTPNSTQIAQEALLQRLINDKSRAEARERELQQRLEDALDRLNSIECDAAYVKELKLEIKGLKTDTREYVKQLRDKDRDLDKKATECRHLKAELRRLKENMDEIILEKDREIQQFKDELRSAREEIDKMKIEVAAKSDNPFEPQRRLSSRFKESNGVELKEDSNSVILNKNPTLELESSVTTPLQNRTQNPSNVNLSKIQPPRRSHKMAFCSPVPERRLLPNGTEESEDVEPFESKLDGEVDEKEEFQPNPDALQSVLSCQGIEVDEKMQTPSRRASVQTVKVDAIEELEPPKNFAQNIRRAGASTFVRRQTFTIGSSASQKDPVSGKINEVALHVLGLRPDTTEQDFKSRVRRYGLVKKCQILVDHVSWRCTGQGYVVFSREADAIAAKKGLHLAGYTVRTISEADAMQKILDSERKMR